MNVFYLVKKYVSIFCAFSGCFIASWHENFSFDNLFPVSCYKTIIAEATELLLDIRALEQPEVGSSDLLMATDCMVGRTMRLLGTLDGFMKDQYTHRAMYEPETHDLVDLLSQVSTAYKTMQTGVRYPMLFPLLDAMQARITETHGYQVD